MKAGRVGSSPNGAARNPSQPLSDFLTVYGEAVFHLNTIVVGLDAVANGYEKPDSLDISWSPADPQIAARKSRKFAVESVLVRCSEALLQYVLALSRLSQFRAVKERWDGPRAPFVEDGDSDELDSDDSDDIGTDSSTPRKKKKSTPAADKVRDICQAAIGEGSYLVAAAMLMVHWRNRFVHTNSRASLRHQEKKLLRDNETDISARYKALSVDCLLCHFEEDRPTLKDVSCLIAMTINLVRAVDDVVLVDLSKEDLDSWLHFYGLQKAIDKVRAETAIAKQERSIDRAITSVAPRLLSSYRTHYPNPTAPAA